MPDPQTSCCVEREQQRGHTPSAEVGKRYHLAPIPAIHQHAGKGTGDNEGDTAKKAEQRRGGSGSFLLKSPNQHGETGHSRAE